MPIQKSSLIPKPKNPWKDGGPYPDPMEGRDSVTQEIIDELHGKKQEDLPDKRSGDDKK